MNQKFSQIAKTNVEKDLKTFKQFNFWYGLQ